MENLTQVKKILIVEDEVMLLDVMRDEFTNAGFSVVTAKDGNEGLVCAKKHTLDIMLVDVLMPNMDGMGMLKAMRQDPALHKIPAIVLTNLNDTKTIQSALENGAYDYMVKSDWNPKDLVAHVKEKLNLP